MSSGPWTARLPVAMYALVAFFIPWPFIFSSWAMVGVAVVAAFTAHWPSVIKRFAARWTLWIPVLFFLLYAVSYFWSEHKDTAAWAIESKLAFVLMPIVLGAGSAVDDRGLRTILRAFVAGILAIGIFCMAQAYLGWQSTGDASLFFYHKLVTGFESHATGLEANAPYMALYVYLALLILLSGIARGANRRSSIMVSWGVALPLIVFFVLLSSRTLLGLFVLLPVPVFLWHHSRRSRVRVAVLAVLALVVCVGIFSFDNPVRKRFADISQPALREAFLPNYHSHDQKFDNLTTRIFVWRVGIETVQSYGLWWRGAGAGDVHYLTDARMDALGIRDIYNEQSPSYFHGVNMHNMTLQVLLAVGIMGVFLLLGILGLPLAMGLDGREGIFWRIWAVTFLLFTLQESALQTHAGIIPFVLFSNLFWNRYWEAKKRAAEASVKPV